MPASGHERRFTFVCIMSVLRVTADIDPMGNPAGAFCEQEQGLARRPQLENCLRRGAVIARSRNSSQRSLRADATARLILYGPKLSAD